MLGRQWHGSLEVYSVFPLEVYSVFPFWHARNCKKRNSKRYLTVSQNSSDFAKIGPGSPVKLNEMLGHASLHFMYRILNLKWS